VIHQQEDFLKHRRGRSDYIERIEPGEDLISYRHKRYVSPRYFSIGSIQAILMKKACSNARLQGFFLYKDKDNN